MLLPLAWIDSFANLDISIAPTFSSGAMPPHSRTCLRNSAPSPSSKLIAMEHYVWKPGYVNSRIHCGHLQGNNRNIRLHLAGSWIKVLCSQLKSVFAKVVIFIAYICTLWNPIKDILSGGPLASCISCLCYSSAAFMSMTTKGKGSEDVRKSASKSHVCKTVELAHE